MLLKLIMCDFLRVPMLLSGRLLLEKLRACIFLPILDKLCKTRVSPKVCTGFVNG